MRFSHHHQKNHSHPAYVTHILTTTDHNPSQDYIHPDDQTTLLQLETVRKSCLQGNESCVP